MVDVGLRADADAVQEPAHYRIDQGPYWRGLEMAEVMFSVFIGFCVLVGLMGRFTDADRALKEKERRATAVRAGRPEGRRIVYRQIAEDAAKVESLARELRRSSDATEGDGAPPRLPRRPGASSGA